MGKASTATGKRYFFSFGFVCVFVYECIEGRVQHGTA